MDKNSKKEKKNLTSLSTNQMEINSNKFPLEFNSNSYSKNLKNSGNLSEKEIEALKLKNNWFFFEYLKLLEKNKFLKIQLQELIVKKKEIHKYINNLNNYIKTNDVSKQESIKSNNIFNNNLTNFPNQIFINRKRKRRKKTEIVYKYNCNFKNCKKKYATAGALTQHMKFKHL